MKHDHPNQINIDGSTRQQKLYDDAIQLLRMTCPPEGFYLATSFGKDSIATHQLCIEAGVKFDAHNNVTGIDPPELVYFGRKYYPDVIRESAGISMWRLIVNKGMPPMRQVKYCCAVLKERSGVGRTCVMGLRAAESTRRAKQWAPYTEFGGNRKRVFAPEDVESAVQSCSGTGTWNVSPLYAWNDSDLWSFIRDRKLPYCKLYEQGFERLGCVGCPNASKKMRLHEFERWPKFREAYVRAFDRLIEAGRFANIGNSGEDIMQWWLQDKVQEKPLDGQMGMFSEEGS